MIDLLRHSVDVHPKYSEREHISGVLEIMTYLGVHAGTQKNAEMRSVGVFILVCCWLEFACY